MPNGGKWRWAMKRLTFWIVVSSAVVMAIIVSFADVVPPRARTIGAINSTAERIGVYYRKHGQLPLDLNALPLHEGYVNAVTDDRNRPLIYTITGKDSFTLRTLTLNNPADAQGRFYLVGDEISGDFGFGPVHYSRRTEEPIRR